MVYRIIFVLKGTSTVDNTYGAADAKVQPLLGCAVLIALYKSFGSTYLHRSCKYPMSRMCSEEKFREYSSR
jgi:hypothetical protein